MARSLARHGCYRREVGDYVETEGLVMGKLGGDVEGVGQWLSSNKGFITREMLAAAASARSFCRSQAAAWTSRTFNMKHTTGARRCTTLFDICVWPWRICWSTGASLAAADVIGSAPVDLAVVNGAALL